MIDAGYLRDTTLFVAIFGFFACVWFGWAQENPPAAWKRLLAIGAIVGVGAAVVGGLLAWRNWSSPSALNDPATFRIYLITVAVEFWACVIGAVVLAVRRRKTWIPVWICAVVGVHFLPLALVFDTFALAVLAVALVGVAVAAPRISRRRNLQPSAVTGAGAGSALLGTALVYLALALGGSTLG